MHALSVEGKGEHKLIMATDPIHKEIHLWNTLHNDKRTYINAYWNTIIIYGEGGRERGREGERDRLMKTRHNIYPSLFVIFNTPH